MTAAVCCACEPGPDAERVVRLADAEFLEEDLGHLAVVVLARVDEDVLELVAPPPSSAAIGAIFIMFGRVPTTDRTFGAWPSRVRA